MRVVTVAVSGLVLSFLGAFFGPNVVDTAGATGYSIAVLAAVSGQVSTLQCYEPDPNTAHLHFSNKPKPFAPCRSGVDDNLDGIYGGTHPGVAAVDIAQGAGAATHLQLDYLPSTDRGGYVYVQDTSGACSYWGGNAVTAWVYHYGPSGAYAVHSASYQHINTTSGLVDVWWRWNNAYAQYPYWQGYPGEQFKLSNTTAGGKQVGTIFSPVPGNPSCSTGAHVHQDAGGSNWNDWNWAEGCFNDGGAWGGWRCPTNSPVWAWVTGRNVNGRFSDAQYTTIEIN